MARHRQSTMPSIATILCGFAAALLLAGPAAAQLDLAPAGIEPEIEQRLTDQQAAPGYDLRTAPRPAGATPVEDALPAWIFVPRVDIKERVTDNVRQSGIDRTADLVSTVAPGIFVSGDTPNLRTTLDYAPTIIRDVVATDQDDVEQSLFAKADATLVPDRLFFSAHSSISEASRTGGAAGLATTDLPKDQRTQVFAFDAAPSAKVALFDRGSGELRYDFAQTHFINDTGALPAGNGQAVNGISDATQQDLRSTLDSGQSLGRLNAKLILDINRTDITNSTGSTRQGTADVEPRYPLTDQFSLVGDAGYQRLDYIDHIASNINGPIWSGGFEYEPRPDSQIRLTYGRHDGANSFAGDMRYSVTPATTLFTHYAEAISTPQQTILGNLAGSATNGQGTLVNSQTGLPSSLVNAGLALENIIYRSRLLTGGISSGIEPNRFSLSVSHDERQALSPGGQSDDTAGGTFSWQRAMSPLTDLATAVSYFVRSVNHEDTIDATVSLTHRFTETLQGSVTYELARRQSDGINLGFLQNSMTFVVRKQF